MRYSIGILFALTVVLGPAFAQDEELKGLIANRELKLKGSRARLVNEGRLLDWSGGVGLRPMDFRWSRVRQLVIDLHEGLAS